MRRLHSRNVTRLQRSVVFTAFLCSSLVADSLLALTKQVPPGESTATIDFPDRWTTKVQGEVTESISSDGVHFLIVAVERRKVADTMGEVMNYIRSTGRIYVRSESIQKTTGDLNGHAAQFVSWHGQEKSDEVEIYYVIFATTPNDEWLAAYWGPPNAIKKNHRQIDNILKSIKSLPRAEKE